MSAVTLEERPKQVIEAVNKMADGSDCLKLKIEELHKRLIPIMSNQISGIEKGEKDEALKCPLADSIDVSIKNIETSFQMVNHIIQSLEI